MDELNKTFSVSDVSITDVISNSYWLTKGNFPTKVLASANISINNKMYSCYGFPSLDLTIPEPPVNSWYSYNENIDAWSLKGNIGIARGGTGGFVLNGFGYVYGGCLSLDSPSGTDPSSSPIDHVNTSEFTQYNDATETGSRIVYTGNARPTRGHGHFSISGYGYKIGGYDQFAKFSVIGVISSCFQYDDSVKTWTSRLQATTVLELMCSYELNGFGYIWSYTDIATGATAFSAILKYNSTSNTWTNIGNFGISVHGAGHFLLYGYAIKCGGQGYNEQTRSVDRYDDALNISTICSQMNLKTGGAGAGGSTNNFGYMANGTPYIVQQFLVGTPSNPACPVQALQSPCSTCNVYGLQLPVPVPNGPYEVYKNETVYFDATGSYNPDGGALTHYRWATSTIVLSNSTTIIAPAITWKTLRDWGLNPGIYNVFLAVCSSELICIGDAGHQTSNWSFSNIVEADMHSGWYQWFWTISSISGNTTVRVWQDSACTMLVSSGILAGGTSAGGVVTLNASVGAHLTGSVTLIPNSVSSSGSIHYNQAQSGPVSLTIYAPRSPVAVITPSPIILSKTLHSLPLLGKPSVTVSGIESYSPDGDPLTYNWTLSNPIVVNEWDLGTEQTFDLTYDYLDTTWALPNNSNRENPFSDYILTLTVTAGNVYIPLILVGSKLPVVVGTVLPVMPVVSSPGPPPYKLGLNPPKENVQALNLSNYYSFLPAPVSTKWRLRAAISLNTMLGNDETGDCGPAAAAHVIGVASANTRVEVVYTTQQIEDVYWDVNNDVAIPHRDTGTYSFELLAYWQQTGIIGEKCGAYLTIQNAYYNSYNAIDVNTLWDHLCSVISTFGPIYTGFHPFPYSWYFDEIWDITDWNININNPAYVDGGHAIAMVDYDENYIYISSWGQIKKLTRNALVMFNEIYVALDKDWVDNPPNGLDAVTLLRDFNTLGGNEPMPISVATKNVTLENTNPIPVMVNYE